MPPVTPRMIFLLMVVLLWYWLSVRNPDLVFQ